MENLTAYSMQVYTKGGVRKRFVVLARNMYDALAVSTNEMRFVTNVDLETLRVVRRISSGADEPVRVYLSGQLFPQKE